MDACVRAMKRKSNARRSPRPWWAVDLGRMTMRLLLLCGASALLAASAVVAAAPPAAARAPAATTARTPPLLPDPAAVDATTAARRLELGRALLGLTEDGTCG